MIYFDNAATSLIKPVTVEYAVLNALRTSATPGRGGHFAAMRAAETVFECRETAAELFNVSEPENVVFTMNATHALNIAINSLVKRNSRVVISGFEHNSVTRPLHERTENIVTAGNRLFDINDTLNCFEDKLKNADAAVCTCVSNVFGYILPITEIAKLCNSRGVPLIIDASQAAGVLPIDFTAIGAAFAAMPGHKGLFGPQGTGILLCNSETKPLMSGGTGSESLLQSMPDYLPDRLEAGTHNVCGIAGLLAGLRYIIKKRPERILEHENLLLQTMIDELNDENFILYTGENQSGVLSLKIRNKGCEETASYLSEKEICVRAGLHCAPIAHESAGTADTGTVRFSFSPFNTQEEVIKCCNVLKEFIY